MNDLLWSRDQMSLPGTAAACFGRWAANFARLPLRIAPVPSIFALSHVAASIPHFVTFEMRTIDALCRLGLLARSRQDALIAVLWMETVIYVALEVTRAMKPWASTNEDVAGKPLWTVVSRGGTAIRSDVIVTIGTFRATPMATLT
jgi:hypothetical protein